MANVRRHYGRLHQAMRIHILIVLGAVVLSILTRFTASAHPSSGIVVDEQGDVFFSDLDRGVLKIDVRGNVTTVYPREGGHWLALDASGSFSKVDFGKSPHWPRWFKRRTPAGVRPALISDGGSPLVVASDGNLYYVCNDERMIPGGLLIARLTPDGKETLLSPAFRRTSDELGGIKGLAVGPGGSIYASYPKAVLKFTLDGKVTTLLNPVVVADCEKQPAVKDAPFLRGLAVDAYGVIYVAASGCRCVIKIMPDGHVETVLKAETPWSPTGIALKGGDIFVLEYTVINDEAHDYAPRVRKLGHDGQVSTLTTMAPKAK
jgi:SMP-30/gluconolaconase/LRE-like protein